MVCYFFFSLHAMEKKSSELEIIVKKEYNTFKENYEIEEFSGAYSRLKYTKNKKALRETVCDPFVDNVIKGVSSIPSQDPETTYILKMSNWLRPTNFKQFYTEIIFNNEIIWDSRFDISKSNFDSKLTAVSFDDKKIYTLFSNR